ncbi:glycosyltransferase family 4 protein [Oribacterium sp. HCP3S3_B9]|uniref:glycosyltransferase family 4 protein n=1 Tax=Oribacterium sp. HCP3S3_B9 TaxID=3438946 RepID=UPI003F8A5805
MKYLFVASGMRFGGAERVMSILANEWYSRGEKVRFFLTGTPAESSYPLSKGINIVSSFEAAQQARFEQTVHIREIRKECLDWKPDVVISFYNDICALTAIAIMGLNIPLIYSERNDPNKVNQRPVDKIYRKIVEHKADKFVFQTEGAKKCYPDKVQRKSCVILNPMDTTSFPTHDFSNEEKTIVSVGRLENQKNQALMIDAFSMIKDQIPDFRLIIYGEGKLRNNLEDRIQQKGLQGRVFLPGAKTGIQDYIKNSALFVLSSDYEGIPNALIEAMAIGLPCVSTDCSPGGARELIKDEKNGLLVPCNDAEELASAMIKMIQDRELAKRCGENAHEIRSRVEASVIANRWLEFIGE